MMQKRHMQQNYALLAVPVLIILGASIGEKVLINKMKKDKVTIPPNENPISYIPAIQIPVTGDRAVRTDFMPFADFPAPSCRTSGNCSLTFLLTGSNQSFAVGVAEKMFPTVSTKNSSDSASLVLGAEIPLGKTYTADAAFEGSYDLYYVQSQCNAKSSIPVDRKQAMCLEGLCLWRNSSSDINDELFKGNPKGNKENMRNEVVAALDFLNSDRDNFNISIWLKKYNDSDNKKGTEQMMASLLPGSGPLIRFPRLMNLASNAYLQYLEGPGTQILFESNKEVPEYDRISTDDLIANLFDMFLPFFYIMVVLYIFPVLLRAIVYEKENKLRMMMKMHGLGDMAYWIVYYAYDFLFSLLYIEVFLLAGKFSGQNFFKANEYSIQLVFFLIYVNWQISLVFLVAAFTSSIKTAQVIGTVVQMLISFLGMFLFQPLVEDVGFSRKMLTFIEIFPGFALYRGIYELQKYAKFCRKGGVGMQWEDLSDSTNGMKEAMIIMCIEWLLILPFAFYIDQVGSAGTGRRKSPLFFLQNSRKKPPSFQQHSINKNCSQSFLQRENDDVTQEREKVECLIKDSSKSHVVVCHNIKKIYPAVDGNPPKAAVKGMSLALPRAECFGMLGPNGAGKTSFISMMIGLTEPTSGAAYVEGLDITTRMDEVYAYMGVCPQHDLLWETLTGLEHLYFYGRLKNLKGPSLSQAVEESLKAVELLSVGDKQAGKYSGGMKRRLSVAISLIGDPKVVYLDEPSTGLDPASRNSLWNVVKHAKKDRAILLTTHSMEEAEALCDRLGIFVDGSLQCVGNSKELKARYGGYFVFTMTTSPNHDVDVEEMVLRLCRDAHKIYHLAGTQKFELPKHQVQLADVFQLVEDAKSRFPVQAWALADTTLEDVFIKVARQAQCFDDHSS